MINVLRIASAVLVLNVLKAGGSEILSGQPLSVQPFVANYASSYNSHVVNHDIRYPVAQSIVVPDATVVQTASLIQSPLFQPITSSSRLITPLAQYSVLPQPAFIRSSVPIAPQLESATVPVAQPANFVPSANPVIPADLRASFPVNPLKSRLPAETAPTELAARSTEENKSAELNRLPQSQRGAESAEFNSEIQSVPSPLLLSSQFIARQFSQQNLPSPAQFLRDENRDGQSPRPQGFSARNVANQDVLQRRQIPQQPNGPLPTRGQQLRPQFFVAGPAVQKSEQPNSDDSESIAVDSSNLGVTAERRELRPAEPLATPKARILYSPASILRSPVVPYTQVINL